MENTGLVSVSFRGLTPEEILKIMKASELSLVEWGSDVHAPCTDRDTLTRIARLQVRYGVKCCSYGTYFRLGTTPLEELYHYIAAAKILGTNILRLWCGNKASAEYTEAEKEELYGICKEAARIAKQQDVILCMECHNHTLTDSASSSLELMHRVGSDNFRMYWQPNQYLSKEENLEFARLMAPYAMRIHVFNWTADEKFPLGEAIELWQSYLAPFSKEIPLLLEFMPDGRPESLKTEADSLRAVMKG